MNADLLPTIATFGPSHLESCQSPGDRHTVWRAKARIPHSARLRRTSRRRRGFTLIESLVSIAIFAVVLTVTSLTLHTMYRADHRIRDELNVQNAFDRLSTQLRTDTHSALDATTIDGENGAEADTLQLTLPDSQSIQYALVDDRVERTLRREEKIEHREVFRLPPSSGAKWRVETERPTSMVSLVLKPQPTSESGGPAFPYAYRIDAAVRLISLQSRSPGL